MKPFSLSKLIASRPICIMQCSGQYNAKSCQLLCEKARMVQERGDRVRQTLLRHTAQLGFQFEIAQ